jgi:2-amino-4-hydroxy-6-hydroxymethyldihydropteridine diphosphokinase
VEGNLKVNDPRAPGGAGRLRRSGFLGLGSNQGDRLANLRAAREALADRGVEPLASSSVYETAPQGEVTDQPDFLNACLRIRTELEPEELLDVCKEVERELGREPGGTRHGPRPIDVDVLLLGDVEYRSERLTLPHAEVGTRRFVLEPLLELDPDLRLPGGQPLKELLPGVRDQRVTPHAGGSWRPEVEEHPAGREA